MKVGLVRNTIRAKQSLDNGIYVQISFSDESHVSVQYGKKGEWFATMYGNRVNFLEVNGRTYRSLLHCAKKHKSLWQQIDQDWALLTAERDIVFEARKEAALFLRDLAAQIYQEAGDE